MIYIIIFFLLVSVYLYCLLGGADFGAGIVETFSTKKTKEHTRQLIFKAIAPIWEANHMWVIIAVVILFNAFPVIYTQISIYLYIPLIILLLGIVVRGTAFTFRHYDALKDNSQEVYSTLFKYSSILVSFVFGLIVGAISSGTMVAYKGNFFEAFIYPWTNLFSISIGIFVTAIFAFIASVYLIGDTEDKETRDEFISKSKTANIVMVVAGGLVFLSSIVIGLDFAERFFSNYGSLILIILSTLSLPLLWKSLNNKKVWSSRIIAGAQLLFILSAFYISYFPDVVRFQNKENLTLFNSSAPTATLSYLGYALLFGSLLIFPSLIYLLKIFKFEKQNL